MSTLSVFNLSTIKNSNAEGVKEGVHYKVVKDGNNLEYKILNFENPDLCPRSGIIELEPLITSRRHLNRVSFRVFNDKELGVLVGIPIGIDDKTKKIIFQKITLEEKETIDLSIPDQAMRWACIKRSPYFYEMVNGKQMNVNFMNHSKTRYVAIDKEREADKFELSRRTKRAAVDIAEALVGADLEDMALNLGFDPKIMSAKTLWMEVVKYSETDPNNFMKVWNSDSRVELSILKRGISTGVISETIDKGINYNGLTLGFNEPEAVKYLKDHPATRVSIDALSKKNEKDGEQSMRVEKNESPIVDEKDAVIARLKAELARANNSAAQANERALELQSESDLGAIDPELAELIKEAKVLGIKGVHNMKDKDKIKMKIFEKKKELEN